MDVAATLRDPNSVFSGALTGADGALDGFFSVFNSLLFNTHDHSRCVGDMHWGCVSLLRCTL